MPDRHRRASAVRFFLLLLAAIAGLATALAPRVPQARAAGTGPIIHWDSAMIYPGENNGYPWGPVGEQATVHGEKFLDAALLGQPVKLALLPGDVNNPPGGGSSYEFCKLAGPEISVGQAHVDNSGNFDYTFTWPAAAGSGNYSICAYNTLDGLPAGNTDDGPFAVLSASAPSVAVSRSTLSTGQSITVTGKHWTPPQEVNVYIAACADCDGAVVVASTVHSSGLNTGTFSITFTIPGNAAPGHYVAGANAHGVLDVGPSGAKPVTITGAALTPTAQPTATTPLATATAAAGSGTGGSTQGDSNHAAGSQNGVSPLLIIAAIGALLLLLVVIVLIVLLARRGARAMPPGTTGGPAPGWGGPPVAGNGSPGHENGAMPPGEPTVQQNWQVLPPGWGDQTPPTMAPGVPAGMPQGDDSPTRAGLSQFIDPAAYPPAPPASFQSLAPGDTPTQPGILGEAPSDSYS